MQQSTPTDEVSRTKVGAQVISQPQREAEIERLAGEIGRLIQILLKNPLIAKFQDEQND